MVSQQMNWAERYWNSAEAADYLNVSAKTVRNMVADGLLRHERIGRNGRWLRFKKEWLDAAVEEWRKTYHDSPELHQ